MKKGFGLIYAILVIVALGTIAIYSLQFASQTSKISSDEHIKIQMDLYLRSAAEWTILWMQQDQAYSRNSQNELLTIDNYDFNISIMPITGSWNIKESNGTVLVDIIGTFKGTDEEYRVAKRFILKP